MLPPSTICCTYTHSLCLAHHTHLHTHIGLPGAAAAYGIFSAVACTSIFAFCCLISLGTGGAASHSRAGVPQIHLVAGGRGKEHIYRRRAVALLALPNWARSPSGHFTRGAWAAVRHLSSARRRWRQEEGAARAARAFCHAGIRLPACRRLGTGLPPQYDWNIGLPRHGRYDGMTTLRLLPALENPTPALRAGACYTRWWQEGRAAGQAGQGGCAIKWAEGSNM